MCLEGSEGNITTPSVVPNLQMSADESMETSGHMRLGDEFQQARPRAAGNPCVCVCVGTGWV